MKRRNETEQQYQDRLDREAIRNSRTRSYTQNKTDYIERADDKAKADEARVKREREAIDVEVVQK